MTSGELPTVSCAVIAGSGLYNLDTVFGSSPRIITVVTPYSKEPVEIQLYGNDENTVAFLPRHGTGHRLPPHRINYKANMLALQKLGVKKVLSINAVGGIDPELTTGSLVVPDQIIDYTWGREHTYYDSLTAMNQHVDFTYPYDEELRQVLITSLNKLDIVARAEFGVYGCTQGPRLETAAEISRLGNDGCSIVGQTAMPETALARELDIRLASLCLVVNRAAGLDPSPLAIDEIISNLHRGMETVSRVLAPAMEHLLTLKE